MVKKGLNNKLIKIASCSSAKVRQLKMALVEGAHINYQTNMGETALMLATITQHARIVEYLLKQGANPLLKNIDNKIASELTPHHSFIYYILKNYELLFATMNNDLVMVTTIINEGAILDFQAPCGYTALIIAVEQNQIKLVEYLLSQGANLFLNRADGQNVFNLVTDPTIAQLLQNTRDLSNWSEKMPDLQFTQEKRTSHFFSISSSNHHCLFKKANDLS